MVYLLKRVYIFFISSTFFCIKNVVTQCLETHIQQTYSFLFLFYTGITRTLLLQPLILTFCLGYIIMTCIIKIA